MGGNNFNGKSRSNTVEVNRTPIELTDENYVSQAEAVIKRLIDENPASAFDLFRARVNAMLDRFMNHLKKYLTKDDVNKIRKRFKK